jgi:FkbM family methyltransferase
MLKALGLYGRVHGCSVRSDSEAIRVRRGDREIRLRLTHGPYVRDIIDDFDTYFDAVRSDTTPSGARFVDFSHTSDHHLSGWDLFPVLLPGLPEPMATVGQYIELTGMSAGNTVLDLGAYAGVTAMAFQEVVGPTGRVVAVEADPSNIQCARENLGRYHSLRGYGCDLIEAAVWSQTGTVEFTAEASLGSAVTEILARSSGASISVTAFTLSDLMSKCSISTVDVIKADIEGAEYMAFSDASFFAKHHPVIVFEPAQNKLAVTQLAPIQELLRNYGYGFDVLPQEGSRLPLVLCR